MVSYSQPPSAGPPTNPSPHTDSIVPISAGSCLWPRNVAAMRAYSAVSVSPHPMPAPKREAYARNKYMETLCFSAS